jgi:hypothetical protein
MISSPIRSPLRSPVRSPLARAIASGLPGTYYDFTGPTLPAPWDTLRRAGLGTRIDAAGAVGYGAHNLLRQSNTPAVSPWVASGGAVAGNVFTEDTSNGQHQLYQLSTTVSAGTATLVTRVKLTSGIRNLSVYPQGVGNAYAVFNLVAGTVLGTGAANYVASGIVQIGDEYRCWVTLNVTAGGLHAVYYITPDAQPAPGYLGDGTSAIRVRISRIIAGGIDEAANDETTTTTTAPVYLPRPTHNPSTLAALGLLIEGQATNLFSRTDDLSVSPWALQAVTVGATRVLGPDGTLSAQRFTPTGADAALSQDRVPAAAIAHTATYWLRSNTGGSFDTFIRLVRNSPFTTVFSQAITVTTEWRPYTITATPLDTSAHRWRLGAGSAWSTGEEMDVWVPQLEAGTVSTSTIPNPGTGTALRTGDFAGGGITGAALAALFSPTAPFTIVLPFRKANNAASVETLLGLCAGASAGTTNQLGIATNGTQAQLVHSGGSGALTGTLVLDGSTVNKVAVSVDPANARASISVNGSAVTETTGIAYTGAGTTHLIPGARDSSGGQAAVGFTSPGIRVASGYITGSALQALST